MLRELQKMLLVLGGSVTSVVRCGLVSVTTPLILMTLDIATKAYMNYLQLQVLVTGLSPHTMSTPVSCCVKSSTKVQNPLCLHAVA